MSVLAMACLASSRQPLPFSSSCCSFVASSPLLAFATEAMLISRACHRTPPQQRGSHYCGGVFTPNVERRYSDCYHHAAIVPSLCVRNDSASTCDKQMYVPLHQEAEREAESTEKPPEKLYRCSGHDVIHRGSVNFQTPTNNLSVTDPASADHENNERPTHETASENSTGTYMLP